MTINREQLLPAGHSKPIGKYSPGLKAGNLIFVSGQVATDEHGNVLSRGDAGGQAEVVFARIQQVLEAGGAQLSDLVSLTIYLSDIARDFAGVSAVRNRVLSTPPPTSTLVEVSRLAEDGCVVEISGIALVAGQ